MPNLSEAVLTRLNTGARSRNGDAVPNTNSPNAIFNAACWSWALNGEYVSVNDSMSANVLYQELYTRNQDQQPTGLNNARLDQLVEFFPQADAFRTALRNNIDNAVGGNGAAQGACRVAMMKIAAIASGLTVVADDAASIYQIHMMTDTWHSWQHWGVGIRGDAGVNYVQKVNGRELKCRCNTMWDEGMTETVIRVDGLSQAHVGVLNNVVAG